MRLIQCIASRNGLFRNKTIGFSEKVTVIYGPNDSGKTFLSNILTDLAITSFLGDGEKPFDWNGTHIDLTMEHDGETFTVSRISDEAITVRERKGTKEIPILSAIPSSPAAASGTSTFDRYLSVARRLGTSGFRETAIIESPLDGGSAINYEQLRKLFLEDRSKLLQLRDLINRTFSENRQPGIPGILEQIASHEKELKLLEKQIQMSNIQSERRQKMADEKDETLREIDSICARITALESTLADARAILTLREEIRSIDEEIAAIERDRDIEQEKIRSVALVRDMLAKIFPKFTDFSQIHRDNLSRIQSAYKTIRSSNERLLALTEKKAALKVRFVIRTGIILTLCAGAAAAALLIPVFRANASVMQILFAASAGSAALLNLASYLSFRTSSNRVPVGKAASDKEMNEQTLKSILKENGLPADSLGPDEIYEMLLQYFEEYGLFTEQETDIQDMESTLRDNEFFKETERKLKEFRSARTGKKTEMERIRNSLTPELKTHCFEDTDATFAASLEKEISSLHKSAENSKELLARLDEELSGSDIGGSGADDISGQIEFHRGKLVTLCRRNRLAHYITTLMDESVDRREDILSRRLASQTASIFHRITSNQYITSINETAILSFMKGEESAFNTQISHIACLSLKLALSDRLAEEHIRIPLFIDEPAVYMDAARIKNFIEIVRECSKERQIIILSHDRSLCDSAETVVELRHD